MQYHEYETPAAGWRGYIKNAATGKVVGWIAVDGEYVPDHAIAA